jgi:lipopolysaccharide/colanic/teichoic acid biosynthesis glycosyltransferase
MIRDEYAFKRVMDIVISWLVLLLGFPVFAFIAFLVKLSSRGPLIYKQTRIGKDGCPFTFFKFRSMYNNCSDEIHRNYTRELIQNGTKSGRLYKIEDDHRVTRVGRVLRRLSLDELPQFMNVLRGDMSLVGPRPPIPYEIEHYNGKHKKRLQAKPGITGLWQISGRNKLPFDKMVDLDLKYIDNWSLALDFVILMKTLPVLVKREGAY